MRPRTGDTFIPIEEPLSVASLAKRNGALLGSTAKLRYVATEDDPMEEPQHEANVSLVLIRVLHSSPRRFKM